MATTGVPLNLYDAVRAAEKREKAARQKQSDMLVDLAIENGQLRQALRRVILAWTRERRAADWPLRLSEGEMQYHRDIAREVGLIDEKGDWT